MSQTQKSHSLNVDENGTNSFNSTTDVSTGGIWMFFILIIFIAVFGLLMFYAKTRIVGNEVERQRERHDQYKHNRETEMQNIS